MTDLGVAYMQKKQMAEALKWLERAVKLEPDNVLALENLKQVRLLMDKKEKPKSV